MTKDEILSVVRVGGKDINGEKTILLGLSEIKGIGQQMSRAIAMCAEEKFAIKPSTKIGLLSDSEIEKIEQIIKKPIEFGVPSFAANRRKDLADGKDNHLTEADLQFSKMEDVSRLRGIRAYRGIRHERNLPVRGQRTRSTHRKGTTLGVKRKKK